MTIAELAQKYVAAGVSVVPIRPDQSKAPTLDWKQYQLRQPSSQEIQAHFIGGVGIACICGKVSGGLEVIDFDDASMFRPWADRIEETLGTGFFSELLIISTPRPGFHVYFRSDSPEGNQKLAMVPQGKSIKATIETRGEGGYVLAPGCPVECHPMRGKYGVVQGEIGHIPFLTHGQREIVLRLARSLNQVYKPASATNGMVSDDRPGDLWAKATSWGDILRVEGYKAVSTHDEETMWTRPGKETGVSVSTNFAGSDLLYVFSTNCHPFEPEHSYSKFAAYALLHHAGDYHQAAKHLALEGFTKVDTLAPAIVQSLSELSERVFALYESGLESGIDPGWPSVKRHWTLRKGEWTLVTGIPSHGKTGFIDAVMVNTAYREGWKWAVWSAENRPEEIHVASLLELFTGKPFNRGFHARMSESVLHNAMKWLEDHFMFLKAAEDQETIPVLLAGIQSAGVDAFVIDPWNELTHEFNGKMETEHVSRQLKLLGRFVKSEQKHGVLIAHPAKLRKEPGSGGKMAYPVPSPYDVSGSAHFRNKADNCLCVWRDESEPGTSVLYIQKIRRRFVGQIGRVDLLFDVITGRYRETGQALREPGEDDE